MGKKIRALALMSGGLDSILAVKIMQEQGVEVTALTFKSPFFAPIHAIKAAKQLDVPLVIDDITLSHLEIVKNPRYGYGKAMNPCIDCHGFMFKLAGEKMKREGYDFIFSGEVVGERPMSQNRGALDIVAKQSFVGDRLLRPLSAKLLVPTAPEEEGIVDRELLYDFSGRGRKPQMALAQKYGITEYPTPAGGCLLTDKGYGERLRDLLDHQPNPPVLFLQRLKTGRHYRFSDTVKCVIGRNQAENAFLVENRFDDEALIFSPTRPGPYCLLSGEGHEQFIDRTLGLITSYSDYVEGETAELTLKYGETEEQRTLTTGPDERLPDLRL